MTTQPPRRLPLMLVSAGDEPSLPEALAKKAAPKCPGPDYLNIGAALSAPPPELRFALPGLLAGTLGLLVSAGGTGKSTLALQCACSLALGEDRWGVLGEQPDKPRRVLYVSAEDPAEIVTRRLHALVGNYAACWETLARNLRIKTAAGANWSFGHIAPRTGRFVPSADLDLLSTEIDEWCPLLVIIDTLNRCLNGVDENNNAAIGQVMAHLESVLKPSGAAALLLHHTSKAASLNGLGDRQEAARGAGALTANARYAQNLVGMSEKEARDRGGLDDTERLRWVRLPPPKANYVAPIAERWLRRNDSGVFWGERVSRAAVTRADRTRPRADELDDKIPHMELNPFRGRAAK